MKKLLPLVALLLGLAAPAHAQGTLTIAGNIQQDQNGRPLAGALLYLYVVNTVAVPQLAFQDVNLTQAMSWPVVADATGRLPFFYVASGSIHARLTDASGNIAFDFPNVLVIGGSGGGGGGGGQVVDPTAIASTGDIKFRLTSETLSGWVVLNGQTIGSATSGATGLASSTAQALFIYLWTNCPNTHCAVTPAGRGGTALADFNANKKIALMDMRDAMPVGRDCMGNTCKGGLLLSNIASGGADTADTPGAFGGVANKPIVLANLPPLTLPASVTGTLFASTTGTLAASTSGTVTGANHSHGISDPGHTHTVPWSNVGAGFGGGGSGGAISGGSSTGSSTTGISGTQNSGVLSMSGTFSGSASGTLTGTATGGMTGTATVAGGSTALPVMNPFQLGTWYIRL